MAIFARALSVGCFAAQTEAARDLVQAQIFGRHGSADYGNVRVLAQCGQENAALYADPLYDCLVDKRRRDLTRVLRGLLLHRNDPAGFGIACVVCVFDDLCDYRAYLCRYLGQGFGAGNDARYGVAGLGLEASWPGVGSHVLLGECFAANFAALRDRRPGITQRFPALACLCVPRCLSKRPLACVIWRRTIRRRLIHC